jgi:hypothetical protein
MTTRTRQFRQILGLVSVLMAVAIPAQGLRAQVERNESDAARQAQPTLPKRPVTSTPAPTTNPVAKAQLPAMTPSEMQDPNRVGNSGIVLGARIDSSISYLGLNRCGARIKQVMVALTDNRPAAYFFEPTARNASQAPVVITMESLTGDTAEGGSRYSILTINPDCSGFYTQTVNWPMACVDVARIAFPNFRFDRRIVANIDSLRASPTLQLSAMKAGNGCVTIKKEIFR